MFAVKGWSVDASSLKPQTEIFKPSKSTGGESLKSSQKRKRGHRQESQQDASGGADDAGRLWEKHIEGKDVPRKREKKEQKRQKLDKTKEEKAGQKAGQNGMSKSKANEDLKRSKEVATETKTENDEHAKKGKKAKRERRARESKTDEESADPQRLSEPLKPKHGHTTTQEVPVPMQSAKLTPIQSAMRQKLISARFRHLNQTLYTEPSLKSQELFHQNPEMFEDYHAGFRQQVSVWPENPLDNFIDEIRRRGKVKPPKRDKRPAPQDASFAALPRTNGTCVIADLGCGDARLAQTLKTSGDTTKLNLKLHSYDLHSPSPLVTKADISNLPLKDGSVDVAIFCLALMGTNWISFVEEAYRILHWKGELWVAEIKSRFGRVSKSAGKPVEHSVGGKRKQAALKAAKETKTREEAEKEVNEEEVLQTEVDGVPTNKEETDVSAFIDVLRRRGFVLKPPAEKSVDLQNKMFVKMEFVKTLTPTKGKGVPKDETGGPVKAKKKFIPELDDEVTTEDEAGMLKPCLYKIR